jgi:hypothetical protein
MSKCTVKNPSKKGPKRHLEIQKVQQNKQIAKRAKAKKGSKMDLKNGTKNPTHEIDQKRQPLYQSPLNGFRLFIATQMQRQVPQRGMPATGLGLDILLQWARTGQRPRMLLPLGSSAPLLR